MIVLFRDFDLKHSTQTEECAKQNAIFVLGFFSEWMKNSTLHLVIEGVLFLSQLEQNIFYFFTRTVFFSFSLSLQFRLVLLLHPPLPLLLPPPPRSAAAAAAA